LRRSVTPPRFHPALQDILAAPRGLYHVVLYIADTFTSAVASPIQNMNQIPKTSDSPIESQSHISTLGAANLRQQVRRALEAAMVAGELRPGELYSAPALSERFGVSATPVREAMLELSKDGFVVAERNRGFRVVGVSEHDLDEISQIRLLLEVPITVEVAK